MADPDAWGVDELVGFFEALGLGHHAPALRENSVDGPMFLQLLPDDDALRAVGINQVLERARLRSQREFRPAPPPPPPPPPEPASPRQTEYELFRVLGTGAFGATCLAVHRVSRDQVAIKQMTVESLAAANTALQEALVMKELQHPLLVRAITAYLEEMTLGRYQVRVPRGRGGIRCGGGTGQEGRAVWLRRPDPSLRPSTTRHHRSTS